MPSENKGKVKEPSQKRGKGRPRTSPEGVRKNFAVRISPLTLSKIQELAMQNGKGPGHILDEIVLGNVQTGQGYPESLKRAIQDMVRVTGASEAEALEKIAAKSLLSTQHLPSV